MSLQSKHKRKQRQREQRRRAEMSRLAEEQRRTLNEYKLPMMLCAAAVLAGFLSVLFATVIAAMGG